MDPITQATLGAVASENVANRKQIRIACLFGFFAGMAPDLDILIRSERDPLLFLEFHRQFSHSLIFIPVGGLICALLFHACTPARWKIPFAKSLLFCTAGYATHGLLDACTSYGTQLFWPFSDTRVSWNTISIIDPLFTLPLFALIIATILTRRKRFALSAVIWIAVYMSLGAIQRERAQDAGWQIADSRGHQPELVAAKPGFGNILLWKSVYEYDNRFYVDGVRAGFEIQVYPGESIPRLNVQRDFPWLDPESAQARDIERFAWFSSGYVAVHPRFTNRVMDVRYSMLPNEIEALWMIELDPDKAVTEHVDYLHRRGDSKSAIAPYFEMLMGR